MLLIGLIGQKTVGKTYTANLIIKILQENKKFAGKNYKVEILPMAAPLKKMAKKLLEDFSFDETRKDGKFIEGFSRNITLRDIQKAIGCGLRSELYKDFWVDIHAKSLENLYNKGIDVVIVDDVRFINESEYIESQEGIIIKICDKNLKNTDKHISEQEYKKIVPDVILDNTKTRKPEDYEKDVLEILDTYENMFRD